MTARERIGLGLGLACMLAFWAGCAQVGSPGGGERDETPPVVVEADPAFGTTGWSGELLQLTFDEFIQVQDARSQVLVSPPLPESPKVLVKGRSMVVDLGGGLPEDRTVVVQFGNAVRDLRESNVAAGLTHVFSTGDVLDSGQVSCQVVDAWSNESALDIRVLLYADSLPHAALDVSLPDSVRPLPSYVGLVNDSGLATIGYLPNAVFGIVALQDANGNYRVDEGEAVAWWPTVVDAGEMEDSEVPLLRLDAPPPMPTTYLSGLRVDSTGFLRVKLEGAAALMEGPDGAAPEDIEVTFQGPEGTLTPQMQGDSLWVRLAPFDVDAEPGTWVCHHPGGVDSLRFRSIESPHAPVAGERPKGEVIPGSAFSVRWVPFPEDLVTDSCSGTVILDGDTLELSRASLALEEDRLTVNDVPEGAVCTLELLPGALSTRGKANGDTLTFRWRVLTEQDLGSVRLDFDSTATVGAENPIWVLTASDGSPRYGDPMGEAGRFENLKPGKYGIVRVDDVDGNGRWTGVDPAQSRFPEPVWILATGIEVRAGWEVELTPPFLPRP